MVNWQIAPAHKTAKFLTQQIKQLIRLPISFNISSSVDLANNLQNIAFDCSTHFCSFDITNMYSNIPIIETTHIINEILTNNNHIPTTGKVELMTLIDITPSQN
jgi:hypothetical protein